MPKVLVLFYSRTGHTAALADAIVDGARSVRFAEVDVRRIDDLSPASDSRFLDAVGEAGHFLSPHYDDFLGDWRAVRHRKMRMTRADVLEGNADLIEHAGRIIANAQISRLSAAKRQSSGLRIAYRNLNRVDIYLNGHPVRSLPLKVANTGQTFGFAYPEDVRPKPGDEVRLSGFALRGGVDTLAASIRIQH